MPEPGDAERAQAAPRAAVARAGELLTELPPDPDSVERAAMRPEASESGPLDWRRELVRSRMFPRLEKAPRIGRYRVLRKLGRGGMGTVVAAHDETLDRSVALKLLHDDLAAKPRQRHRLLREAQAMARVSHPNVVTVYEADVFDDQLYIAMELVDGLTLDAWQRKSPRSWRECFDAYVQAGRGLEAAHEQMLVHRDFKPGNCIIDAAGRVRVLDFGLARDTTHGPVPSELTAASNSSVLSMSITVTGAMLGTIAYMSPEQLQGKSADARSDQFSFCVSLWEALHGQRPFVAETAGELLAAILQQRFAPLPRSERRVPRWLRRILRQGLALHPSDRYPSMTELLARLEAVPRGRRRLALGSLGVGLLALVGVASAQLASTPAAPCEALRERPPVAWDAPTREATEAAILRTELPDAAAIWSGVSSHLDAYADEWSAERLALCEAGGLEPTTTPTQLTRRSCLDDRARLLGALSASLQQADRRTAARAVSAAESLPPVSECRDAAEPPARPVAPEALRPEIEDVLERTARVFVLERLGGFEEGLLLVGSTLELARPLAERYEPPLVGVLLAQGRLLRRSRSYAPAEQALIEAMEVAERSHDDRSVEDVLHELVLLSIEQERLPEARVWLKQARAKAGRVGPRPLRDLRLVHDDARIARATGELELAAERLHEVVEGYRALPHAGSRLCDALTTLALVREAQGRTDEARQHYQDALAGYQRHGDLQGAGEVTYDLAGFHLANGELPEAVQAYERALALFEASHGEASPLLGSARYGMAHALLALRELPRALEQATAAEQLLREGGTMDDRIWALALVANIHRAQQHHELALESFLRAEGLAVEGIDDETRATVLLGVGDSLVFLERPSEAAPRIAKALELLEHGAVAEGPSMAHALISLGQLRELEGRFAEARTALDRAWVLVERHEDPRGAAMVAWTSAKLSWRLDDAPTAREQTAKARELYAALGAAANVTEIDEFLRACGRKCQ